MISKGFVTKVIVVIFIYLILTIIIHHLNLVGRFFRIVFPGDANPRFGAESETQTGLTMLGKSILKLQILGGIFRAMLMTRTLKREQPNTSNNHVTVTFQMTCDKNML